jgi:hypothetical protein
MCSLLDSPSVLKAQRVQGHVITVLDLRLAEFITLRGLLQLVVISGALIDKLMRKQTTPLVCIIKIYRTKTRTSPSLTTSAVLYCRSPTPDPPLRKLISWKGVPILLQ